MLANFVLNDRDTPIALYMVRPGSPDSYREKIDELISQSKELKSLVIDVSQEISTLP